MSWSYVLPPVAVLSLTLAVAAPSPAQSIVGPGKTGPVPDPVSLDTTVVALD